MGMTRKKLKVAIIGCGAIASSEHIKAYMNNDLAEIKYLVDIKEDLAQERANAYGVPFVETDYRNILQDKELDAVSICTPNDTHAPIAIDCLNAGKHVLCEKPAAINGQEAREMEQAAKNNQRILNIGVVNRFSTSVNNIKSMIDKGELGKIYHVYSSFRSHRSIPGLGGPFTTKAKSGGGVLIDWGVHFLDLILYAIGQPKVLTVSGAIHSEMAKNMKNYAYINMWAGPPNYNGIYDVEDFVTGLIRTTGPTITLNGAWAQNIGEEAMFIEFLGDQAGVKLQYGGDFKLYTSKNGMLIESTPSYAKTNSFYDEINDFLHAIQHNVESRNSIRHVIQTSEIMDALYQSADMGKEVSL